MPIFGNDLVTDVGALPNAGEHDEFPEDVPVDAGDIL